MEGQTGTLPTVGWDALDNRPSLLQPGDVVHTQHQGLLSRVVRWFGRKRDGQRAWASHTAMVLTDDPLDVLIESLWRVEVRSAAVYRRKGSRVAIHRRRCGLSLPLQREVCLYALSHEGAGYGWWKLLFHGLDHIIGDRYLFRRLARNEDYPICSWLVLSPRPTNMACDTAAGPAMSGITKLPLFPS